MKDLTSISITSSDDVIDAIPRCIKVLESPTAQPEEFTKVQALDSNKVYAAEQLTRAGVRLAQLLDSIKWQCLAKREDAAALAP